MSHFYVSQLESRRARTYALYSETKLSKDSSRVTPTDTQCSSGRPFARVTPPRQRKHDEAFFIHFLFIVTVSEAVPDGGAPRLVERA